MEKFFFHTEQQQFIIAFFYVIISFTFYYFISTSTKIQNLFIKKFGIKSYSFFHITFNRLLAILIYGVIPLLILLFNKKYTLLEFGLNFKNIQTNFVWILILCSIIIFMNYINRENADNLKLYPQIRKKEWNLQLLIYSSLGWIGYLCAYEFMLRGFLLYACFYAFGIWPAILINITIYSLIHIPKGMKETVGAVLLGFILCLLTFKSGSIFAAILIHIIMAISNEWLSLSVHPDIHLIRKKNN